MNEATRTVLAHLQLEERLPDRFTPVSANAGWPQVFGGQLIQQALCAAHGTVDSDKALASIQATFISRSRLDSPLTYTVDRLQDGNSAATRQVAVSQDDKLCVSATIAFHKPEERLSHQAPAPTAPAPEACADLLEVESIYRSYYPDDLPERTGPVELPPQPVEMRFVDPDALLKPGAASGSQMIWIRFSAQLGDDLEQHKMILGYASDQSVSHVALQPHALGGYNPGIQFLTMNHSLWFHRSCRVDEWLLLTRECSSMTSARANVTGSFYTMSGDLVATMQQTALVRTR